MVLTHEQVLARNLATNFDAKTSSSRYAEFSAKYGDAVYELEALRPSDLQGLLREAIDNVMDVEAYRREQKAEEEDAFRIEQIRKREQVLCLLPQRVHFVWRDAAELLQLFPPLQGEGLGGDGGKSVW